MQSLFNETPVSTEENLLARNVESIDIWQDFWRSGWADYIVHINIDAAFNETVKYLTFIEN